VGKNKDQAEKEKAQVRAEHEQSLVELEIYKAQVKAELEAAKKSEEKDLTT